ncbi:5'/3'-nucleotidase SurE [Vibrio natriegens]|uniref:5'/3'-nucleotidase SurE n=1 Tax=Vibrio natriegens TaxID=691 RepID=UPI0020CFB638|nr:5'/3'-nucleotidase SurE [Vibrio natriegens]
MNKLSKLCVAMAAVSTCAMSANAFALNIVLTNDDSWDTTNINVMKSALEAAGHDVIMSAPCTLHPAQGKVVKVAR